MALRALHVSEFTMGKFNITKWSNSFVPTTKASSSFNGRINSGAKNRLMLNISRSVEQRAFTSSDQQRCVIPTEEEDGITELPLIPIPLVLLPGMIIPFQIYEFRYRIMMQTLLQTDQLRFGVVYHDKATGLTAHIGCVAKVVKHEKLVDDRFFLVCTGKERFRVGKIVQKLPYLVGEVKWLKDQPYQDLNEVQSLAMEVNRCMKDVGLLSDKLGVKKKEKKEMTTRDDVVINGEIVPAFFSFFIASSADCFSTEEQQALLELDDTSVRLKRERDMLVRTRNYLAAKSAIRDVFDQFTSHNED